MILNGENTERFHDTVKLLNTAKEAVETYREMNKVAVNQVASNSVFLNGSSVAMGDMLVYEGGIFATIEAFHDAVDEAKNNYVRGKINNIVLDQIYFPNKIFAQGIGTIFSIRSTVKLIELSKLNIEGVLAVAQTEAEKK